MGSTAVWRYGCSLAAVCVWPNAPAGVCCVPS